MKYYLCVLCAAILLVFASCSPASKGPDVSTPPTESVSSSQPESNTEAVTDVKDISNYYIEEGMSGISDQEAVKALCLYLWGNLKPKDYCFINVASGGKDPSTGERTYLVEVYASDKAPVDTLLQDYDGPWAPVNFNQISHSFLDVAQAQVDMRVFLEKHSEIEVTHFSRSEDNLVVFLEVVEITDELANFAENYSVKDVYKIYEPQLGLNPD